MKFTWQWYRKQKSENQNIQVIDLEGQIITADKLEFNKTKKIHNLFGDVFYKDKEGNNISSENLIIDEVNRIYTFTEKLIEMFDIEGETFKMEEPLYSITVYSFADQKVVTLYKNPEDVPLFIEKVTFIEKKQKSSWHDHREGV